MPHTPQGAIGKCLVFSWPVALFLCALERLEFKETKDLVAWVLLQFGSVVSLKFGTKDFKRS